MSERAESNADQDRRADFDGDILEVLRGRRDQVDELRQHLAVTVEALEAIKERCDRIVAGEFGGLEAALEMSNEARRALNVVASDDEEAR